jgi:hypothetical protein
MSYGLANPASPIVIKEIEKVLDEYSEYPYHAAFLIPELRQQLITHILRTVPNHYTAKGSQNPFQVRYSSPLQERMRLNMVIRGSILHVLRENANWLSHHLP